MRKGILLFLLVFVTGLCACGEKNLPASDVVSGQSVSGRSASARAAEGMPGSGTETDQPVRINKEKKELFRYVSKNCFYTDFEGESMIQTDVPEANTICQRSLSGKLLHSYPMGDRFEELFYVDEDWLYFIETDGSLGENDEEESETECPEVVYRVPLIRKGEDEIPEFSKKEVVFREPKGLDGWSDFTENSFLQIVDDVIYYDCIGGFGTYDLRSKEQHSYPIKGLMNAAGTKYAIAEGEKQKDFLTEWKTGKSRTMKTTAHPWLRLGKEYYFRHPYSPFGAGDLLLDLNSGETIEVLTRSQGEQIAEEMRIPWEKGRWGKKDGMTLDYLGYYDHRVYAEIQYPTVVTDKKGRKVEFMDAVCVSRDMDQDRTWKIEKKITAHARKEILDYYKKAAAGRYKNKADDDEAYMVEIGEGVANGIFYFAGTYKKKGKLAMDIYDLDKKELRVIGRHSPETFYPFYDNGHAIAVDMHHWQGILALAPIMSQDETVWDQKQKKKIQ